MMKSNEVTERARTKSSDFAVFAGTQVPVKILFECLADDQTLDTFLEQFPTVSREQAHAVLGASRDLLLGRAPSH